jgi:RNA polymerase sigma factor (sigma-70 family)
MTPDTLTLFLQQLRLSADAARWGAASDGELLDAFGLRRDEAAFAELMRRHGSMVFGVCRRVLGNEADAEDAFQATFAALARKAGSLRREPVGGWLHRVAARAAGQARRGADRRRALLRRARAVPPREPGREATWEDVKPVLDEELSRLPDPARRLLVACYLQGKTHAQAAAEVGVPLGSVDWHLGRARERLRRALVRRGVALSAGALGALMAGTAARAAVPAVLLVHARAAAIAFAAGSPEAVPVRVAALAKGALSATTTATKVGALLALGLALAGAGLFARHALNAGPDAPPAAAGAAAAPGQPEKADAPEARRDLHGDPLPAGALVRLGTVRLRHAGPPGGVAFHPDGKHLLTAAGGAAVLWDRATGREVRRFGAPAAVSDNDPPLSNLGATALALSADGRAVALAYRQKDGVRVWDVATGKELRRFPGEEHGAGGLAFSPDGKALASAGMDGQVALYDLATGKETARLNRAGKDAHRAFGASALAFSPDGKGLAVPCVEMANFHLRGAIKLFDVTTGREVREVRPAAGQPLPVAPAFSPDGKTLAWDTSEGTVVLTDAATGRELRRLGADGPCRFAFVPDGKSVVAARVFDRVVVVWDAATGQELRRFGKARPAPPGAGLWGHAEAPGVAVSPDGRTLAAAGAGHTPLLIDLATGKDVFAPTGHQSAVRSIHYSADGQTIITRGDDGTVRRWDAATGREAGRAVLPPDDPAAPLAGFRDWLTPQLSSGDTTAPLSGDGSTFVTAERAGPVHVWDTATGKEVGAFRAEGQGSYPPALSADGSALALTDTRERVVHVRDRAGKELHSFELPAAPPLLPGMNAPVDPAKAPVFSPDGKLLAVRSDTRLVVHSLATGREVGRLSFPPGKAAGGVVFSPDGRSLALDRQDGTVGLWEVATGRERHVFGTRSKTGPDKPPALDARGKPIESFGAPRLSVPVAFSGDGRLLALARGRAVTVWDAATGKELARLEGHGGDVTAVAIAPDGRSLATGSTDTTALVWDVAALGRLVPIQGTYWSSGAGERPRPSTEKGRLP